MQISLLKDKNHYKAFAVVPGETTINKRGQVVPAKKQLGLLTEASISDNKDTFQTLHQKNKKTGLNLVNLILILTLLLILLTKKLLLN
jgi:hypothetical protein